MLAEDHGVIPGTFDVKDRVAEVGVGKAPGLVELLLDAPAVTRVTGILVGPTLHPKKVIGHVFDRIEADPVCLGAID